MTNSQFRMSAAEAEQRPGRHRDRRHRPGQRQRVLRRCSTRAAANSDAITVDLSDVTYCDSAAVRALFAVAATDQTRTDRARDGTHLDAAEYLRPRSRRDRGDPRLNMAPPHFQPHQHPQLVALMHRILERMQFDLLDALGTGDHRPRQAP